MNYFALSLTVFLLSSIRTYACIGYGCFGCLPPLCPGICMAAPRCIGGVCMTARAKAARTFKGDTVVGQIVSAQHPNGHFSRCCSLLDVPPNCQQMCTFDGYNSSAIQSSLSFGSACPVTALSLIHFCAGGGVDHSRCCRAAGIKPECINFCDQRPDKTEQLSISHLMCLDHFDGMKDCFLEHALTEYYRSKQAALDQSNRFASN
ncbi:hypothetical protein KIN20_016229 [Parelaphostrongylus tenuis]|uniref:Domain of unknown function DB domain-containing protein n=1 Tax=Parelaphostrongylus tenuis TaxID=148309 RepID=A0AAD5MJP6_PARTN|nr:hypothetical protein KIN20_016229 [Parelaphostrongylus tenuis]